MVEVTVTYEGDLHTRAVHGPSGAEISTDAPVDNRGRGEAFSPTDLVGTAVGTCMATIMGIVARDHGIALEGMRVRVLKEMIADPRRRIARLQVTFDMPAGIRGEDRKRLENAAHTCPVVASLSERVAVPVEFRYPDPS